MSQTWMLMRQSAILWICRSLKQETIGSSSGCSQMLHIFVEHFDYGLQVALAYALQQVDLFTVRAHVVSKP